MTPDPTKKGNKLALEGIGANRDDSQRTDDDEEEAQQHGTGTDDGSGLCVAETSNERSDVHDDQQDYSPYGGTDGVSERVDGGGTSVQMETHDEHVVECQPDESRISRDEVRKPFRKRSGRMSARLTQRSRQSCFLHTKCKRHRRCHYEHRNPSTSAVWSHAWLTPTGLTEYEGEPYSTSKG